APASGGAILERGGTQSDDDRDAERKDRAGGGTHPNSGRCAGFADHHPLGKVAAGPRVGNGSASGAGLQCDRHRQQSRPRSERTIERAEAAIQHGGPARVGLHRRRSRDRTAPGQRTGTRLGTSRRGAGTPGDPKASSTLSTAEAISVMNSGLSLAGHFGDGRMKAADLAAGLQGAVVKNPGQDGIVWREYLETVVKERDGWRDLYRACRDVAE